MYRRLNASLTEHHILPRYARLADSAEGLSMSPRAASAPRLATAPLDEVRKAFHAATDAWHDVEHIQSGPWRSPAPRRAPHGGRIPAMRGRASSARCFFAPGRDPAPLTAEGFAPGECRRPGAPRRGPERLLFFEAGGPWPRSRRGR